MYHESNNYIKLDTLNLVNINALKNVKVLLNSSI